MSEHNDKSFKSDISIMLPKGTSVPRGVASRKISEIHEDEFKDIDTTHFDHIISLIKRQQHKLIFITGGAGTGKSTLVRYIQYYFAHVKKNTIATATIAPTGIAAMSAHGETIHSFFCFPPAPADTFIDRIGKAGDNTGRLRDRLIENLDVLIIDEISMVRADMFDAIEKALRVNRGVDEPFGGVKIVLFGDLLQLPPIVRREEREMFMSEKGYRTEFFPGARYFSDNEIKRIETRLLQKVFRQEDEMFIKYLNAIRMRGEDGYNLKSAVCELNKRVLNKHDLNLPNENIITLVPTNAMAEQINSEKLEELSDAKEEYKGEFHGKPNMPVDNENLPVPLRLYLKKGAQVMIVKNDTHQRRWVNGTLAKIVEMRDVSVDVKLDNGSIYNIPKAKWTKPRIAYDPKSGRIVCEEEWSYEQIPVVLGWAATIHKCQGITLDRVIIDMGNGAFDKGQTYVALSRCRSLNGLYLKKELMETDIIVHQDALDYYVDVKKQHDSR